MLKSYEFGDPDAYAGNENKMLTRPAMKPEVLNFVLDYLRFTKPLYGKFVYSSRPAGAYKHARWCQKAQILTGPTFTKNGQQVISVQNIPMGKSIWDKPDKNRPIQVNSE